MEYILKCLQKKKSFTFLNICKILTWKPVIFFFKFGCERNHFHQLPFLCFSHSTSKYCTRPLDVWMFCFLFRFQILSIVYAATPASIKGLMYLLYCWDFMLIVKGRSMFMFVDSLRQWVYLQKNTSKKAGEYFERPVLRILDFKCPSMLAVYLVYSEYTV